MNTNISTGIFRLCNAHISRNIKKMKVPENVKNKLRSLICIEHPDFDGTLREIEVEGGKPGQLVCLFNAYVTYDCTNVFAILQIGFKIRYCKPEFALEGICWAKELPSLCSSGKPGDSTSNVIESLHVLMLTPKVLLDSTCRRNTQRPSF